MSSTVPDDAPRPRLCHMKKWPGFNGYGFNLHAEKGKAGQYIGKVDPDSPADLAGLREGDRIVEVNGTNISNENHQQVVKRIKAVENETKLLVVDRETDDYYKEKKIVIRGDMANVLAGVSPDANPSEGREELSNNVDRNSTHSSHSDNATTTNADHPYKLRLCHLKIWPDFQGYGFNLHAEKNKPGQYIGKVDEGSPAEAAGLRERDRILEVNGQSVVNDNHQEAVKKIKSIPNETRLLVVDSEADEYFRERDIALNGDVPFILHLSTPSRQLADDGETKIEVSADNQDHPHKPRLVQLETWPDYSGYGFNMQSIKGKPGEFIGKVEPGSPAHVAGLKEGDHIIEVGGENIEDCAHHDVVAKIKAAQGRALLLVVDADADRFYKEKSVAVTAGMPNVVRLNCPRDRPQANGVSESARHEVEEHSQDTNTEIHREDKDQVTLEGEQVADSIIQSAKEAERSMEDEPINPVEEQNDLDNYEEVDAPPSPSTDNNNDDDKQDTDVSEPKQESVTMTPIPEPEPPSYSESQSYPLAESKEDAVPSSPTSVDSQKSPVTIAGIEFAASAEEARRRVSGRKKDVRLSQSLSAKEKYDLFQRL